MPPRRRPASVYLNYAASCCEMRQAVSRSANGPPLPMGVSSKDEPSTRGPFLLRRTFSRSAAHWNLQSPSPSRARSTGPLTLKVPQDYTPVVNLQLVSGDREEGHCNFKRTYPGTPLGGRAVIGDCERCNPGGSITLEESCFPVPVSRARYAC